MLEHNTNLTSDILSRSTIGHTKIRSPTRYSDMFVGVEDHVIDTLVETPAAQPKTHSTPSPPGTTYNKYNRIESLRTLVKANPEIQTLPSINYKIITTLADAKQACLLLTGYHTISVLWEGVDVNRHGTLAWLICGYLGSAVLFNITKCGAEVFRQGGLKDVLEAKRPTKVIHDCTCLSDLLYHQYNVKLRSEGVFDSHAADLLIQTKTSPQPVIYKTLTECLIEYQDIPITVYRLRESVLRKESAAWLLASVPDDLIVATARLARYAVLLRAQMLSLLVQPLPLITELYLRQRDKPHSPNSKSKQILFELQEILTRSQVNQNLKTEWNIPESVLNPTFEPPTAGQEHFYSRPFKFDPKKATPGALKIFSVNPNTVLTTADDDWEKHVQAVPTSFQYCGEDEEEQYEPPPPSPPPAATPTLFKIPDMFSDASLTSSDESPRGSSSRGSSPRGTPQRGSQSSTQSDSSSSDGIEITLGKMDLPPTLAAKRDPSLLGSKIVWPGDEGYGASDHKVPVMSQELSNLVEEVRAKQLADKTRLPSRAFISTEEMRRNLEAERCRMTDYFLSDDEWTAEHKDDKDEEEEEKATSDIVRTIDIDSSSCSSSSDIIVVKKAGWNRVSPTNILPHTIIPPEAPPEARDDIPADLPPALHPIPTKSPPRETFPANFVDHKTFPADVPLRQDAFPANTPPPSDPFPALGTECGVWTHPGSKIPMFSKPVDTNPRPSLVAECSPRTSVDTPCKIPLFSEIAQKPDKSANSSKPCSTSQSKPKPHIPMFSETNLDKSYPPPLKPIRPPLNLKPKQSKTQGRGRGRCILRSTASSSPVSVVSIQTPRVQSPLQSLGRASSISHYQLERSFRSTPKSRSPPDPDSGCDYLYHDFYESTNHGTASTPRDSPVANHRTPSTPRDSPVANHRTASTPRDSPVANHGTASTSGDISSPNYKSRYNTVVKSNTPQKPAMCFAYDSDDPENF